MVPALAVALALWWGQLVLIPLVLSILISWALEPVVVRLGSLHIPRPVAVPMLLATLVGAAATAVCERIDDLSMYAELLEE